MLGNVNSFISINTSTPLMHSKDTIPAIQTNITGKELRGLSPNATFMCLRAMYIFSRSVASSAAGK
jgi:hypothetical protein